MKSYESHGDDTKIMPYELQTMGKDQGIALHKD